MGLGRRQLMLAVIASVALSWPAAAEAHHDFEFGPAEGGTRTTFTVRFTADLDERGTSDDPKDFYIIEIKGPPGCSEASAFTRTNVAAGESVTVLIDPSNIKPFGERSQWCPGAYTGSVYFCYCDDHRPDIPVGSFEFVIQGTVLPEAVSYAGRTDQGRRIRLTLSADGTEITRLRVGVRGKCRARDRTFSYSDTLFMDGNQSVEVRAGRFTLNGRVKYRDARGRLTVVGRISSGGSRGRLRVRLRGSGFTCDSGSISWSAAPA
jgi:hypothetical protein